jgi:hypothetical protein
MSGFSDDKDERLDKAISEEVQEINLLGVVVGVWVPGEGTYAVAMGNATIGEVRRIPYLPDVL